MQQLCEAGEAEFLEIMDLVGMASKPMHVRRLQKALQEWVQNPGKSFNTFFFFTLSAGKNRSEKNVGTCVLIVLGSNEEVYSRIFEKIK